ncbi:MAG: glutamate ligase domain-containing protein, partial [Tepidimonas sp.]|uniref:glutamate ligase domain-containing protein n=1 Tax=Tepidimonas sp. TaxID=2002775 RepID=UPI004055349C
AAIERQFHHLLRTVPPSGRVIANALEESLARVLHQGLWSELRTFGAADSDYTAEGDPQDFAVLRRGETVARVRWALTGLHNQLNALAAIAAAEHVGVDPAAAAAALATFENVRRRLEVRGRVVLPAGEVTVYDDFAHHPTAIRATIDGLRRRLDREGRTADRILAIFEPRSNTMRLGTMKERLPWALEGAALAFCHAGGLDWDATAALAPMGPRAQVAPDVDTLVAQVTAVARPGDHLLCMSNGAFGGVHGRLLAALRAR